jgi:hypothetical protein
MKSMFMIIFFKIAKINLPFRFVKIAYLFENVVEKMLRIGYLNSNIVTIGIVSG